MIYAQPGTPGAVVSFKPRYGNYIGGEFVPPVKGEYFVNTSPVNGEVIAEFPRSGAEDIERALISNMKSFEHEKRATRRRVGRPRRRARARQPREPADRTSLRRTVGQE